MQLAISLQVEFGLATAGASTQTFCKEMEAILLVVSAIAAVIAALAFARCPKGVMIVCTLLLLIGSIALALVVFGPKDYLLRVPASLATVLHPYILAPAGLLCVVIGAGGLAGMLARRLIRKSTTEK